MQLSRKKQRPKVKFKSKPLINYCYIDDKRTNLYPKLIILSGLQILLGIWMISFLCVGYFPTYNHLTIQELPEWVATFRSVSLFLIAWYLIVSSFILHYGIQEIKYKNLTSGVLSIVSFCLIPSFANLIYLLSLTKFSKLISWVKQLFASDPQLEMHYSRKNWKYQMMVVVLIIMTPIVCFIFYRGDSTIKVYPAHGTGEVQYYTNWWFNSLQYFTIQTNAFCYLFVLLFVIYPDWKLFKSHSFLIYAISYLLIVGATYDFILLPTHIISGSVKTWSAYEWVCNVWEHMIDPLVFCGCGIALLCKSRIFNYRDYLTTLKYGIIIPTVYIAFGICNCFVTNESVYGWFTNCNPDLWNNLKGSTHFMPHGEPYLCLLFALYWLIFIGVITSFWTIDQAYKLSHPKDYLWNIES